MQNNPEISYWNAIKSSGIFSIIFSIAAVAFLLIIAGLSYFGVHYFQESTVVYMLGGILAFETISAILIFIYQLNHVGFTESFLCVFLFLGFNLLLVPFLILAIFLFLSIFSMFF